MIVVVEGPQKYVSTSSKVCVCTISQHTQQTEATHPN